MAYRDDNIDPKVRFAVGAVNDKILGCLSTNDYTALEPLLCDELNKTQGTEFKTDMLPRLQPALAGCKYRRLHEYYVTTTKSATPVHLAEPEPDAYEFNVNTRTKETYIALVLADNKDYSMLLTFVYGKYDGKWKLNIMHVDDYSVKHKNAAALYEHSKQLEMKGHVLDATAYASLAAKCTSPSNVYLKYKIAPEIKQYQQRLDARLNSKYHFPIPVTALKSEPKILGLQYVYAEGPSTPLVSYKTSININDTVTLKAENEKIHAEIGKVLHGLDKNNSVIMYHAYNDIPTGNGERRFGMMHRIKF
ncbi:MAG: hypothetical protein V4649_07365 [Bacteroidota bacterium]